jgi:tight adherence protein C
MDAFIIYFGGFFSIVFIVMGIGIPVLNLSVRHGDLESENILSQSAIFPLITILVNINRKLNIKDFYSKIEKNLMYAGYPGGRISGAEYLAVAQITGVATMLFFMFLLVFSMGSKPLSYLIPVMVGGLAIWLMIEYINNLITDRNRLLSRQLPYFLDLSVMTMGSGASLQESMVIYLQSNPKQVLSEELRYIMSEVNMGKTFREALQSFHHRVVADDVKNAINGLLLGIKMGTPLRTVIIEQADVMRFERSQKAERAAEELKVRIMGPIMLMMIALFILILGPAMITASLSGVS